MIDRGLSAARIPIGIAQIIQRIAPPKTSDAVTGAASMTMVFTLRRLTNDWPRSRWRTSRLRKSRYWTGTEWFSPRKTRTRSMSAGVALLPAASTAGSFGMMKKMMYVTIVTAMNRTQAQRSRRMM